MYDKSVAKVNNIDTSGLVVKTKYDTDKLQKEISDTSELVKNLDHHAKIIEIKHKIPSMSGLGTNATLTGVEN